MSSACERVFATPELLEAILIQLLPLNELLCASTVCQRFHSAIRTSPLIQRLLYLRAEPCQSTSSWTLNPLLRKHFLPWFVLPTERFSNPDYESLLSMDAITKKRDAFLRAEASWRNMLVVQPPPKQLNVTRCGYGQGGSWEESAVVPFNTHPSGGVTMGVVYDLTVHFLRNELVSEFGLSFKNTEAEPQVTLYLVFTQQCCHPPPKSDYLVSQGAEAQYDFATLPWVNGDLGELGYGVIMAHGTDLSPEIGGVGRAEWRKWKEDRKPLADLDPEA